MPAEGALVQNFKYADYVEIVCGSLERLPHALADMDVAERLKSTSRPKTIQPNSTPMIETGSMPILDRQLIRSEELRRRIDDIIRSKPPHVVLSRSFLPSATV